MVELLDAAGVLKFAAYLAAFGCAVCVLVGALVEIARGRRMPVRWIEGQRRAEIRHSGAQPEGVCGQWTRFSRRFEDEG